MSSDVPKYIDSRFAAGMLKLKGPVHSELLELIIVQEMEKFGIDPAVVFAFERTCLWITNDNIRDSLGRFNFTQKQLDAWEAAQVEFYKRKKTNLNE